MNRYFEMHDDHVNHHKFWEIIQDGTVVNVRFGRIGTKGQTQVKTFNTIGEAENHSYNLVRQKQNKGYFEKSHLASGQAAMAPLTSSTPFTKPKSATPKPKPAPPSSLTLKPLQRPRRALSLPPDEE